MYYFLSSNCIAATDSFLIHYNIATVTFDVREEAVGVSQVDLTEIQKVGESARRSKEFLEDDYGIPVNKDHFKDIVSGVDPSKISAGGRVGDNVRRIGFGLQGRSGSNSAGAATPGKRTARVSCILSIVACICRTSFFS